VLLRLSMDAWTGERSLHRGPFIGPEWPPPIQWDRRLELAQPV
jgi:hypothetical protein